MGGDPGARRGARAAVVLLALTVAVLVAGAQGAPAGPTGYEDSVLADGPAGYWRLGETTGTAAADRTGNGNPGTYQGGVVLGVAGALQTSTDKAARFDGGNDLVSMGDPASGIFDFGTDDFAVEAWVKTTAPDERSLIGKRDLPRFWQVTVTDDPNHRGQLRANIADGTTARQAYSTKRVDDGGWHHVVVSFDRDTGISFIVDGAAAGFTAGASLFDVSGATVLQVGKMSGYAHFKGDLDEVAVYRSTLTLAQAQVHYYDARPDSTAPTVSLTAPVSGTTVTDITPRFEGVAGIALGDSTTVDVKIYQGESASGTPVQTLSATRAPDGTYSVDATSPLTSTVTYTARAEQSDWSGNTGLSAAVTFPVDDGTPPPGSVAIAGAGDIAWCGNDVDEQTADLLEGMPYAKVFTLGDNVYANGTPTEYATCYDPSWGRVKDRTYPAAGGHDYLTANAAGYFGYFGAAAGDPTKGYYSYELGSWHVVVLNSECTQIGGCGPGSPQENWLRRDLAAHPTDCTLAYWHEPRWSSGAVHGSHPSMDPFWRALYDYGVDVTLAGDDHVYERFLPQTPDGAADPAYGVTQFTVGTGGYLLYDFKPTPLANSAARINDTAGVLKLVLHSGRYDWQFVGLPGSTSTDAGTADCHGSALPPPPPPAEPPPPGQTGPYPASVLSDSPRGYWRLGEISGNSAADQTGAHQGTYLSGVTLGVLGALTGDSDSAAGLDGGDDRVSMGDPTDGSLDFGTGDFTVEAWTKASANDDRAIVSKKAAAAGQPFWQVTVTDDGSQIGRIRVTIFDGTINKTVYGPTIRVDDNAWHHVVVLFDRDTGITVTVDGTNTKANPGAVPGDLSTTGDFIIGKASGYAQFKGALDEVAVYPTLLDPARIQAHYAAGRG